MTVAYHTRTNDSEDLPHATKKTMTDHLRKYESLFTLTPQRMRMIVDSFDETFEKGLAEPEQVVVILGLWEVPCCECVHHYPRGSHDVDLVWSQVLRVSWHVFHAVFGVSECGPQELMLTCIVNDVLDASLECIHHSRGRVTGISTQE